MLHSRKKTQQADADDVRALVFQPKCIATPTSAAGKHHTAKQPPPPPPRNTHQERLLSHPITSESLRHSGPTSEALLSRLTLLRRFLANKEQRSGPGGVVLVAVSS